MKKIKFLGTGGGEFDYSDFTNTTHLPNINSGSDHTLCGITLDGDTSGDWVFTDKPINCRRCIEYVHLCKSVKQSEITKGKQRY